MVPKRGSRQPGAPGHTEKACVCLRWTGTHATDRIAFRERPGTGGRGTPKRGKGGETEPQTQDGAESEDSTPS